MEEITFETRDEFNRKPFAESLITLFDQNNEFSQLAIDGSWGTGKTEFCLKTVHLINQKYSDKLIAGYLNAFAEDPYDDPLCSILSKLYATFVLDKRDSEILAEMTSTAVTTIGVKALCYLTPIIGEIAKEGIEKFNEIREKILEEDFKNKSKLEKEFQKLKELIEELSNDKNFVLFIDELDRCRPDFALHLLEIVKHVFDIPKLKIVFVVNHKQLIETVRHHYCNDEKIAKRYLDKFFQVQLKITNYTKDVDGNQTSNSSKYFDIEIKRLGLKNIPIFIDNVIGSPNASSGIELLRELIEYRKLSLRDVEKLTKYILIFSTFINCSKDYSEGFKLIFAYAIFEFTFEERLYENYRSHNDAFRDCGDLLTVDSRNSYPSRNSSHFPFRYVVYELLFSKNDDFVRKFDYGGSLENRRKCLTDTFSNLENLIKNS